jgi:hypothetical protein
MATLTAGLKNLQRQLDDVFPDRHRPDGWIGDAAHRANTSGHNPDDTSGSRPAWNADADKLAEVRALDVAADLGPGVDSRDLVAHLIRLPGLVVVVRYIIHRGKIYHSRNGFDAETYDGGNRHDHHIHFEGAWSQAADTNDRFNFRLEEIPVALTDADTKWLTAQIDARADQVEANIRATLVGNNDDAAVAVWKHKLNIAVQPGSEPSMQEAGSILRYTSSEHHRIEDKVEAVGTDLDTFRVEVREALAQKPTA